MARLISSRSQHKPGLWLILGAAICIMGGLLAWLLFTATKPLPALQGQIYSAQTRRPLSQAIVICLTQKYPLIDVMSLRGKKSNPLQIGVSQTDATGRFSLPALSLVTLQADDLQEIFIYRPGYLTSHYRRGAGIETYDVTYDRWIELAPGSALPLSENLRAEHPDVSAVSLLARLYWFAYYFQYNSPKTLNRYQPLLRQLNQQFHQDEAFILQTFKDPNQSTYWEEYLAKLEQVLYPKTPLAPAE